MWGLWVLVAFAPSSLHASVFQCPDGSPPPCRGARVAPTSVAVLYFDNASPDTSDAYLADGITEEIISRLGEVGRLQVKSHYLVRRYRGSAIQNPADIGRQLQVASIVTGSVRRSGSRLRVTAEMVRTSTGDVVWSDRYDRADTDVLSLQADLAGAVATAITGRLLPAERRAIAQQPTRAPEAWDHFLRGNALVAQRNSSAYARALNEYESAARLDPGFSRALARIAFVYGIAAWRAEPVNGLSPDSCWQRGHDAADRAIAADPNLSDAWLARGLAQVQLPESVGVARVTLARALALDSGNAEAHHVYAWTFYYSGDLQAGLAEWHRALALEPGRAITLAVLAYDALARQKLDSALLWADSAIATDPTFQQALRSRVLVRVLRGDTAGARVDADKLAALSDNDLSDQSQPLLVSALEGDSAPLRAWTRRATAPAATDRQLYYAAQALALLGDADGALDALDRIHWKALNLYANLVNYPFTRLRGNPRFERLAAPLSLPRRRS